jgi:transcriptional regulator with XRE-family HTH domain
MATRMDADVDVIVGRLKKLRTELRISQRALGKLCGRSGQFISLVEAGESGISEETLNRIADALGAELGRTRLEVKEFLMGVVGEIAHNPQYVEKSARTSPWTP